MPPLWPSRWSCNGFFCLFVFYAAVDSSPFFYFHFYGSTNVETWTHFEGGMDEACVFVCIYIYIQIDFFFIRHKSAITLVLSGEESVFLSQ